MRVDETVDNGLMSFERGTAASGICAILRRDILTLRLEPGAPLDETGLSKRFNVSRSPIREVLSRLSAEGLVQTLPNRTTVVAPVDLANFPAFIEALDLLQRYATRLAARNRTREDLAGLRALADRYSQSVGVFSAFDILQSNYEFHVAIAEAGRNPYILRDYSRLLSEARRLLHIHIKFLEATNRQSLLADQHNDLIEAIEARDVKAADAAAHTHTLQFHDRFLTAMTYEPDAGFSVEATMA